MNRYFCRWFLFSIPIILFSFCISKNQNSHDSNEAMTIDSVSLRYPRKVVVKYSIKNDLVDISQYLIFKDWGHDAIKRYSTPQDTLTISWNYNVAEFDYDNAINQLNYRLQFDGMDSCSHSISKIDLGEVNGDICEAVCNNRARMIFMGINMSNHIHIMAIYDTKSGSPSFRNTFADILKSMTFR